VKDDDLFSLKNNKSKPKKGDALLAEPFLHGKYFGRAVILVAETTEKGAIGFVLNKPLAYNVGELVPDLADFDLPVFLGGPVDVQKLYFVHTLGNIIPQSIHIKDNLYWGGDFETIALLIKQKQIKEHQIRFFVGYSGWTEGQLELELEEGSWVPASLKPEDVMGTKVAPLWEELMGKQGEKFRLWSNFPENPSMN
jgi:putative transcriptional regulator